MYAALGNLIMSSYACLRCLGIGGPFASTAVLVDRRYVAVGRGTGNASFLPLQTTRAHDMKLLRQEA